MRLHHVSRPAMSILLAGAMAAGLTLNACSSADDGGPATQQAGGGIHIVQEYAELNGATTGEGAAEILKDRTGVLYFGFPECPWCRIAIPVMNEVAQAGDIDQIHYVDARELRDTRVLSEDGDGCHRGPRCRCLR